MSNGTGPVPAVYELPRPIWITSDALGFPLPYLRHDHVAHRKSPDLETVEMNADYLDSDPNVLDSIRIARRIAVAIFPTTRAVERQRTHLPFRLLQREKFW